jgi:CelD/BcsL family acetyltransferase involved in cellulose biosynthesis
MARVLEINRIDELSQFRREWEQLLRLTPGGSFFQSLEWLEVYWRHFGQGRELRVLLVSVADHLTGILPLVVEREPSKVGPLRVLTFPLHAWGSFYGPIGSDPEGTLTAGLEHVQHTRQDWDFLELRWLGAVGTDPRHAQRAMLANGFQAYLTQADRSAVADLGGSWDSYWSSRKGAWLRRYHHAERALAEQGDVSYVRYRPAGSASDDGLPRWDLYNICEELARRSWQGTATDGTTLSHEPIRTFLREVHEAAAAAGAVDLNLLLIDGLPVAFIYGYHYGGYVYGLRRGYDASRSREGAGNVLLAYTVRDSFARGDRIYDMGVGSLESKRHLQTRLLPILRCSHYPPSAPRTQVLRLKRWWQSRRLRVSAAAVRTDSPTAEAR